MRLPRLFAIASIVVLGAAAPSAQGRRPALDAPALALQAFLELDTDGAQLTDAGWPRLAALVSDPGPRRVQPVQVYEDWFVMGPGQAAAGGAEVWTEGRVNGHYDPRTGRYWTDPPGPMKFRHPTVMVRKGGAWKVRGPMPAAGVLWQAVLRHATELRDTTADPRIKRHATQTVRALTRSH